MLAALSGFAQVNGFQLPYNPDSEPDGYIGVQDVLELLQLYGTSFDSEVFLNNDTTAMVMEVGVMNIFECLVACDNLPSNWKVADMTDFGLALDSLPYATYIVKDKLLSSTFTQGSYEWTSDIATVAKNSSGQISANPISRSSMESEYRCLCATHERPSIEYAACSTGTSYANYSNIEDCVAGKVAEGWYPLGSIQLGSSTVAQSFWRYAE